MTEPSSPVVWRTPPTDLRRSLVPPGIHVWRISITADTPEATVASRRGVLTPEELARADRFYSRELTTRWLLGRSALRLILSRYVGVEARALVLATEAHGKPFLDADAMSLSADGLPAFNLSHAGDLALLAVSNPLVLGIDIEQIREMRDADAVAARFFSSAEHAQFTQLEDSERLEGFFRCWTRKEAFIKAIGDGLSRPLSTFDVDFVPGGAARLLRAGDDPAEAAAWWMTGFVPETGYLAAIAARTRTAKVDFFAFDDGASTSAR